MLKGLSITPPVVGRITIGRVVEKNGRRLPEKDDQFTITSQIQQRGEWLAHPADQALRKATTGKLRAIPVRLLFNSPDLNLRADYSLFDRETGRPVCVGNGETCRRVGEAGSGMQTLPCPAPDGCAFGQAGGCKPYARLNVVLGDDDELGSFIFRTTSYNSIRTVSARLHYFNAVSGNLLACLPLELKLRGKSTTQSFRTAIYYVDLGVRSGVTLEEALGQARELDARRRGVGFDQAALDAAAYAGFANGAFEDTPEERAAVAEEFYPETPTNGSDKGDGGNGDGVKGSGVKRSGKKSGGTNTASGIAGADKVSEVPATSPTLHDKLERKAVLLGGAAA